MTGENPYKSPKEVIAATASGAAPLLWSVATVFGCAVLGGLTGLVIGAALGSFVPGYYRSVFPSGADPSFDPVAVGIGQGLTQGAVFGGIVGLAIVAFWYWFRSRPKRPSSS